MLSELFLGVILFNSLYSLCSFLLLFFIWWKNSSERLKKLQLVSERTRTWIPLFWLISVNHSVYQTSKIPLILPDLDLFNPVCLKVLENLMGGVNYIPNGFMLHLGYVGHDKPFHDRHLPKYLKRSLDLILHAYLWNHWPINEQVSNFNYYLLFWIFYNCVEFLLRNLGKDHSLLLKTPHTAV